MELDDIVKLAGSGNFKDVEQHWMSLIERSDVSVRDVIGLAPILDEYAKINKADQAESLAWAAIESLKEKRGDEDALRAAKPFLLKLNKSGELKRFAEQLYREVYADREGLDALVEEAGIGGGRPPRRAIRTLDVCLAMTPGSYVTHRDDDMAAKVESMDTSDWQITVDTGKRTETLGPVEFADQYAPCDDDDFRVLARFDKGRLQTTLNKKPAEVIENILKSQGNRLDSDELKAVLTPRFMPTSDWSKWWTKARAAIKRSGHIKVEGRSPYQLEFIPGGHAFQNEFAELFEGLGSPAEELSAFEGFIRDCKARDDAPDREILKRLRDTVAHRAERLDKKHADPVLAERLVESVISQALGEEDSDRAAVAVLSSAPNPAALMKACESAPLWRHASACLKSARPQDWVEVLAAALPWAPSQACSDLAEMLDAVELPESRMEEMIGTIVSDAPTTFRALFWLWDKGLERDRWKSVAPITVLTRMLWLLGDVQRSDQYPPSVVRQVCTTARVVLSARKYGRYLACLETLESGMGAALRTQVQRLDNLGRKVEEDLLNRIRSRFPELYHKAQKSRWEQEDVLYVTREGMARKEGEINEIANVKMRENAKAIGAAAEKGDLSENSEYKFALEERDLLRARLAQMQKQFAIARPLQPEQVPDDHVGVGSKVELRHLESGEVKELTFLGPFDADTDAHIYNYQAPIAQALMGSKIGDRVELEAVSPEGIYEIVGLRPWTAE